jgi:hypothetical protein
LHDSNRRVRGGVQEIAHLKFQLASSGFGKFAAAASNFAAVQQSWRDFRIAP